MEYSVTVWFIFLMYWVPGNNVYKIVVVNV